MSFSADIKNSMRDCILKLFWSKDDIVSFFKNNSCTVDDIKHIGNYKELNRNSIVDEMFDYLSRKPDRGLGQFRAMLQSLINWSHFDPYYFDNLKKLDRAEAKRSIDHLRQLQEIRDHKIQEQRKNRERKEAEARAPKNTLAELKDEFISLLQGRLNASQRGYALEDILLSLSNLSLLDITDPFRVNGEQIDGSIKFDGEHYLVEAKWQDKAAANEAVYQFAGKIEGKMYGRGFFVSIHGFSEHVVSSLVTGKAIKTVFIDGADLTQVLEGFISFSEMLDKKIKAAQTKGLIYIDSISGKNKI